MTGVWWQCLFAFAAGFVAMEYVAAAAHRYLMHGPLWALHRSHHAPGHRRGVQANDLFALLFAGVAIALFAAGGVWRSAPLWWAGAGARGPAPGVHGAGRAPVPTAPRTAR